MTQLLATATRNTIYSATPIDHVFRNFFSGNPDCGILDAGLIDQTASFVKLPFFCKKKYDDTETTYQVLPLIYDNNNAKQV